MVKSVTHENLKEILSEIKNQFINIAIQDNGGEWSDEYFIVEGVKDIKSREVNMTALLLVSPKFSHCAIVDITSISGIKFNKYLNLNGTLLDEIKIQSDELHPIAQ